MNNILNNLNIELVSIIIPTYNRAKLLKTCISSIIGQTYSNIEIIVIDDGSNDETEKMISEIKDKRIFYIKINKSGNLSEIRNYGVKISNGCYIAFCDDDDIWFPEKLEIQLTYMKYANICCTNALIIDQNANKSKYSYIKEPNVSIFLNIKHLLIKNFIITSTILVKRKILGADPFNTLKYKNIAEDYDLWMRLSLDNDILLLNKELIFYRIHNSLTHDQGNDDKLFVNSIDIIDKYSKKLSPEIRKYACLGKIKFQIKYLKYKFKNRKYYQSFLDLLKIIKLLFNFENIILILEYKTTNKSIFFRNIQKSNEHLKNSNMKENELY